jgi:hypothetical protein
VFTVKNGATSMLSTNLSIDQGEYDSSTAITPAVIDVSHNSVSTGDKVWVTCSTSGANVTYCGIEIAFQLS